MTAGPQVVLDACVLVNAALRDSLLRLAEPPRLYLPRWSGEIIEEMTRTLKDKIGLTPRQINYLVSELEAHFGEAWIAGYELLLPQMKNHVKDRHVLAAAAHAGAETVVTFNLKHFPPESTAPWDITAQIPDDFLVGLFRAAPDVVYSKMQEQAERHGGIVRLLGIHRKTVPGFVELLCREVDHQ
jgi:hypothetical protein